MPSFTCVPECRRLYYNFGNGGQYGLSVQTHPLFLLHFNIQKFVYECAHDYVLGLAVLRIKRPQKLLNVPFNSLWG